MPGVPRGNLGYRLGSSLPLGRASWPVRLVTASFRRATCPVAGAAVLGRKRVPGNALLLPQLQAMLSVFPCPGPVQPCLAGALAWQLPFLWGRHGGSHRAARASVQSSMWPQPGPRAQFALPGGAREVPAKASGFRVCTFDTQRLTRSARWTIPLDGVQAAPA